MRSRLLFAAYHLLRERGRAGRGSLQHLYAVITAVGHDHTALTVDQNTVGRVELPISAALAADGSYMLAVAVAQHLHPMIIVLSYNNVACTVKRDAGGLVELASA